MISIAASVLPTRTICQFVIIGLWSVVIAISAPPALAQNKRCPFETADPYTLAKCLLRPVKKKGILGETLPALPSPLEGLIGQPLKIRRQIVQQLLQARNIHEADLGGALSFGHRCSTGSVSDLSHDQ